MPQVTDDRQPNQQLHSDVAVTLICMPYFSGSIDSMLAVTRWALTTGCVLLHAMSADGMTTMMFFLHQVTKYLAWCKA